MILNILIAYPIIITVATIFFSIITYNPIGIYFAIGNIVLGFSANWFLKLLIKYLAPNWKLGMRPSQSHECGNFPICDKIIRKTWGMPSGHMQIATLASTFWILYLLDKKYRSSFSIIILAIIPFLVGYSRIYLGCHNLIQVIVGGIIGLIFGIILYWTIKKYNDNI